MTTADAIRDLDKVRTKLHVLSISGRPIDVTVADELEQLVTSASITLELALRNARRALEGTP